MLQINPYISYTPLKPSVNFGKNQQKVQTDKDEFSKTEDSQTMTPPSAGKTLGIVSALTGASVLTSLAISGRVFNAINGLVPAMTPIERKLSSSLGKIGEKVAKKAANSNGKIKAKFYGMLDKTISWINGQKLHGVEKELRALNEEEAKLIKDARTALRKTVKAENSDVGTEELKKIINERFKNDEGLNAITKDFQDKKNVLLGTNLSKKAVKTAAGTFAGGTALKQATKDENGNGYPDSAEKIGSHKSATKRVTAALIDVALDSAA